LYRARSKITQFVNTNTCTTIFYKKPKHVGVFKWFSIKYSCASVGVNKLSDIAVQLLQIR